MEMRRAMADCCDDAAASVEMGADLRTAVRIRGFELRAEAPLTSFSGAARRKFVEQGEKLLVDVADHRDAARLAGLLFEHGYDHWFDVPARAAAGISRLEKAGAPAGRIDELRKMREAWLKQDGEHTGPHPYSAAMRGDAKGTIDGADAPMLKQDERFQEWVKEARAKMK
jgi:hypothetical protein